MTAHGAFRPFPRALGSVSFLIRKAGASPCRRTRRTSRSEAALLSTRSGFSKVCTALRRNLESSSGAHDQPQLGGGDGWAAAPRCDISGCRSISLICRSSHTPAGDAKFTASQRRSSSSAAASEGVGRRRRSRLPECRHRQRQTVRDRRCAEVRAGHATRW